MKIKSSYQIDEATFIRIYRAHCHYRFHLRRSFYLSWCLLILVTVMEQRYGMDFEGMDYVIVTLVIISTLFNGICDFLVPKAAYKNLKKQKADHGTMIIQNDGVIFEEMQREIYRDWNQYQNCIETADAFILYQRDLFTIIMKNCCNGQIDEVRNLLKEKVNRGKTIKQKK